MNERVRVLGHGRQDHVLLAAVLVPLVLFLLVVALLLLVVALSLLVARQVVAVGLAMALYKQERVVVEVMKMPQACPSLATCQSLSQ